MGLEGLVSSFSIFRRFLCFALVFSFIFLSFSSHERRRTFITKIHANLVFQAFYLFFEAFQEREFKEMLGVSYLVVQPCISF